MFENKNELEAREEIYPLQMNTVKNIMQKKNITKVTEFPTQAVFMTVQK